MSPSNQTIIFVALTVMQLVGMKLSLTSAVNGTPSMLVVLPGLLLLYTSVFVLVAKMKDTSKDSSPADFFASLLISGTWAAMVAIVITLAGTVWSWNKMSHSKALAVPLLTTVAFFASIGVAGQIVNHKT